MRVIAGAVKGRRLLAVPGEGTRPITDRAKEALFSILGDLVVGARVLDLFAGTGGVAIEALSRGAASATLVDLEPRAVATIRQNLARTGFEGAARVVRGDAFAVIGKESGAGYDLIYIAPPQYRGQWRRALEAVDRAPGLLADDGLVVVQIHPREEEPVVLTRLQEVDRRRYGSVRLLFYAPPEDLQGEDLATGAPEAGDLDPDDGAAAPLEAGDAASDDVAVDDLDVGPLGAAGPS